jgi:hypothetical protein
MATVTDAAVIIAQSEEYAGNALAAGVAAMDGAINVLNGLGKTISSDPLKNLKWVIDPPAPGDPGDVPDYQGSHFSPDTFTGVSPTLVAVSPFSAPTDPAAPPADLDYHDPQLPSGMTPDESLLSGIPTIDALPTIPAMPDLETEIKGIIAPTLTQITIPTAPTYVAPEFLGTRPSFDAVAPTDLDLTFESSFSSSSAIMVGAANAQLDGFLAAKFPQFASGMAAIETRLATYLAGGTALTPLVQDAMYNRAVNKTAGEKRRASAEAAGKSARTGLTMPSPMLLSQQQDIDQQAWQERGKVTTEIYIKIAEMEQANLQFAVEKSSALRKIALDATLAYYDGLARINGQAVEYARGVVDAVVKAFDVSARYAETQARIYEADAQVYRAQLEGALAVLHAYEATVRGLEAQAMVDKAAVEAYTARINAVQAEANVYRAQVDAIVSLAGLERIKVELYDAKVKAFGSQVNAYSAQWVGYEAAVKGQTARMEVNVAHSREYEAAANAYVALVKGREAAINAQISTNKSAIDTYRAQVEAYAALQHAKVEGVSIDVTAYKATIEAFIAKAQAIAEKSKSEVAVYDVELRSLIAQSNIILEEMKESHHLDIIRVTGLAQVAQTIGREYGALGQAALSGMNALASNVTTATAS